MQKLNVLILEDDPEKNRIPAFVKRFHECKELAAVEIKFDWVEHAQECIDLIIKNNYDLIFLDHDLGGQTMVDSTHEDCGSRVSDFLEKNPEIRNKQGTIIVHSFNRVAGPIMAKVIGNSTWVPGIWLHDIFWKTISFN